MAKYVNADHLRKYLRECRMNQRISPDMDVALLNIEQMLTNDIYNPILFGKPIPIGECERCMYKNVRHQKCSCCRRNPSLKDCYREDWM